MWCRWWWSQWCWWCWCALALAALARADVTVERLQLNFDEEYSLTVNSSVEYILQFAPASDGDWPSRVLLRIDKGDTARPVLVTARRKFGAVTWQLPYHSGDRLMYELERTLCPDDAVEREQLRDDCDDGSPALRGELSLHVGSSCAADTRVVLRVSRLTDWLLPFDGAVEVHTKQGAPSVLAYRWPAGQERVRVVLESDDDVCATIALHNYTCPLPDTLDSIQPMETMRMTMQRSGGAQLARSAYPRGFYVIALVMDSDVACSGEPQAEPEPEWLWDAAVLGEPSAPDQPATPAPPRDKTVRVITKPALSLAGYVWAGGATLAVFLLVYAGFGALVLAQRLPACRALVGPRAVLQRAPGECHVRREHGDSAAVTPPHRRRDSTMTFDSSDNSDSDAESLTNETSVSPDAHAHASTTDVHVEHDAHIARAPDAPDARDTQVDQRVFVVEAASQQETVRNAPRPFGLPASLTVAALARRRARVLKARSDRYLSTLYTVGLFYALPVVQFVAAFQIMLNVSGSLDICYYNFLCAHPAGGVSDFNHVLSNLGYLMLGALFMLQVRRRRKRRKRKPRDEEYGIPAHYGLLSALGAAMMMVALLSAAYHVCPNGLNFQFDTAFMYVLAVLSMVKIYQSRHPDINARAHATFGVLAVLIAIVVWGVLGGGPLFWSVFTVLHVFTFLLLSLRIYYLGQFRFEKESLSEAARGLGVRPLYTARLVLLLIANAVNWGFALYGLVLQPSDFASHLLSVLLCNTLLHMVFYLTMKLLHGERPRWYVWALLAGAAGAWAPALYYFAAGSSDWSATPARSRHSNHECRVLRFYDAHDLWHMLSAAALYLSFNVMLTWDDGLAAVKRDTIPVF